MASMQEETAWIMRRDDRVVDTIELDITEQYRQNKKGIIIQHVS